MSSRYGLRVFWERHCVVTAQPINDTDRRHGRKARAMITLIPKNTSQLFGEFH